MEARDKLFQIALPLLEKSGQLKGPASPAHGAFMDALEASKHTDVLNMVKYDSQLGFSPDCTGADHRALSQNRQAERYPCDGKTCSSAQEFELTLPLSPLSLSTGSETTMSLQAGARPNGRSTLGISKLI